MTLNAKIPDLDDTIVALSSAVGPAARGIVPLERQAIPGDPHGNLPAMEHARAGPIPPGPIMLAGVRGVNRGRHLSIRWPAQLHRAGHH